MGPARMRPPGFLGSAGDMLGIVRGRTHDDLELFKDFT